MLYCALTLFVDGHQKFKRFHTCYGLSIMKKFFVLIIVMVFMPGSSYADIFPKLVSGTVTMRFDLSSYPVDREVKLWIPYPVSSAFQTISRIKVEGNYTESGVYTDNKFQTSILYARWKPGGRSRKLSFRFDAKRMEVVKKNFPARETCWDPADYRQWLMPSSLGPTDGVVRTLAEHITKGKRSVLEKARAIYDWTCKNMYRDETVKGCGIGDVRYLLKKRPGGKCTDIHSAFVALCRAAGVPAREIFGIRMCKKTTADITRWEHCWAEFYLPGYGWIPVDPADVRKFMLVHGLALDDPETEKWHSYFWGAWDPYRITLSVGRDLILNPSQAGPPLNNFGYPYAEVNGAPLDWLSPETFSYKITCVIHN